MKYVFVLFLLFSNLMLANPVLAHGDDDHEHAAVNVAPEQVAPRAMAQSEEFELVAVLQGRSLIIYLDRYADNEAVIDAQVEVESAGGFKLKAVQTSPGVYVVSLAQGALEKTGKYPLSFSVLAGELGDLLTATMEIPEHAHDEHEPTGGAQRWWSLALAGVAVLGLGLLMARLFKRKSGLASLFRRKKEAWK